MHAFFFDVTEPGMRCVSLCVSLREGIRISPLEYLIMHTRDGTYL